VFLNGHTWMMMRNSAGDRTELELIDHHAVCISDAIDSHRMYSSNLTAAAAAGLLAGVDIDCGPYYQAHLPAAVEQGLISEADIDVAALRILTHQFKLGTFDPFASSKNPYDAIGLEEIGSEAHQALSRESAIQVTNHCSTISYRISSSLVDGCVEHGSR
jgi:beta-glucosidase-like glycosyl hydrolase